MSALVTIFQFPIVLLNLFGFIGSAIWLLLVGRWKEVLIGIIASVVAPFLLGLALLPSFLVGAPAIYFAKRRFTLGLYFFSLLSSTYICAIIVTWCGGVLFFFLRDASSNAFWPLLIWSYGVATSPWTYMAQKDESPASVMAAFFTQVAFIVLMAAVALGASLESAVQIFTLIMVIEIFFHMHLIVQLNRAGLLESDA
jgi:hypothetical protein